jgi:hypothetical protein
MKSNPIKKSEMPKVKTQDLSVTQYAELRGITRAAVKSAILNNYKMDGVQSVGKVGNMYVIKVDVLWVADKLNNSNN